MTVRASQLFSVLFLVSASCLGQAGRAELFGTILDPAGLPVPKAKVEAEDQATMAQYSATSNGRGEYHILGLPAGQYILTVQVSGFRMYRQSGITLRLGDRTVINATLEVGQPAQSVNVTAAAPLLQTASSEVSLNVDKKAISTLPLDGRNFIPLVTLSPGVALPNGQFLPRSLAYCVEVIRTMKDEGCDAVVLGCTEIPLLVTPESSPLPVLDSTRILARAAVSKAVED